MATGNGKGTLVVDLLAEVRDLRAELRAHVDSTGTRFGAMQELLETLAKHMQDSVRETRERFERMDMHLERVARVVKDIGITLDDHETRLGRLEGR